MKSSYDIVCIGAGLSNMLFLHYAKEALADKSIAVIDPDIGDAERYHWSYWSKSDSYFDQFSIGEWDVVSVKNRRQPVTVQPYTLRLVESDRIMNSLFESVKSLNISYLNAYAKNITNKNALLNIHTDDSTITAPLVFDSAIDVEPIFPIRGYVSGYGQRFVAEKPLFSNLNAEFCDVLPSGGVLYLLPLSDTEILLESAYFARTVVRPDYHELEEYLKDRFKETKLSVTHTEYGIIPLGLAGKSMGPGHVLMGAKRGLVKASTGYGIVAIDRTARDLAKRFMNNDTLPACRTYRLQQRMIDSYFLGMLSNPEKAVRLARYSMATYRPEVWLGLMDESLSFTQNSAFMTKMIPYFIKNSFASYNKK